MNLQQLKNISRIPFWYEVAPIVLTALGSSQATLNLNTDSHFLWTAFFGTCSQDADTDFMPNNFTVQIVDQGTGRNLTSAAVPQRLICAPSNGGGMFANMTIFPPNTVLTFNVTDLSNAGNTVNLCLKGVKLFNFN